jgi:hypothetical protein
MGEMRALAGALATGLVLLGAGCGSTAATSGSGSDAAALVPADALAFVHVDGNLDSDQWQIVDDLTGALTLLRKQYGDLRPAIGDELDLALLDVKDGEPEAIALARPDDEAKLRALATKFDRGDEHYTVQKIGGWSVVADSNDAFDSVRRAESGRSLADVAEFQTAMAALDRGALATAYAGGHGLEQLPGKLGALVRAGGSPRWVVARLGAGGNALRLQLQAGAVDPAPTVFRPRLLRDVPSGALLAVSFKDAQRVLQRLAGESLLPAALRDLGPALRGEGVLYVTPGVLLPTLVLELESANPAVAARALRRAAARLSAKAGNLLALHVLTRGNRVFVTNALAPPSAAGGRLVDDQPFKDALAAADAPDEVTWLAYADIHRLVPIVQALSQLLGGSGQTEARSLDRIGTLVAFGARSGSGTRLELRLTGR